jgi:hypothetical protein
MKVSFEGTVLVNIIMNILRMENTGRVRTQNMERSVPVFAVEGLNPESLASLEQADEIAEGMRLEPILILCL